MGYFHYAIKGLSWSFLLRAYTRIISLVRVIILARFFLSPYEFGLFGIVALLLNLLEILTETGVNVFLIQEKTLDNYINSAWVVSIMRGALIACVLLILSHPIAAFFNTPPVAMLLLITTSIPLIKGFINPSEIKFQKELSFEKEFIFRSVILTIETAAIITVASLTHTALSFVIGMIASACTEVTLSFLFIKPTPTFMFNWKDVKKIFHKGKWVTLYGIFQYFAENADNITAGKLLGAGPLALYENAYTIAILPVSEIGDVVSKVTFPVFTRISRDKKRLAIAFFKTLILIIVGSIFITSIVMIFPKQIILFTFGKKWIDAAKILPLLATYGLLRAIFGFCSVLFLAVKKQEYVTQMVFARFLGLIITIVPLVYLYGLRGAGYSALLSVCIEIPIAIYFTLKVFNNKSLFI